MKALVVGGTGPTGPYIVEGLVERGYEVSIFHRGVHEVDFAVPVEHIHADPHFPETIEEVLVSRTFDLVVCTYGRLRHVAQVMRRRTARFIAVGGAGAYRAVVHPARGPAGIPVPISEDAPLNFDPNLDKFTYMMATTEQEVMALHDAQAYNVTLFRYPGVYGPRQLAPREWCLMRRILDGRKQIIIPNSGLVLQSRGYAENMAYTVLLAVDKPAACAGQIYNAADETVISVREWVERVAEVMDHEWELVDMPYRLARPCRSYAPGGHHLVLDLTKIKAELGYKDLVPVDEALRQTIEWWLAHRPEPGGEIERHLADPFDYATEDRFIQEYRDCAARLLEIPLTRERRRHPYPHPKRPGEYTVPASPAQEG